MCNKLSTFQKGLLIGITALSCVGVFGVIGIFKNDVASNEKSNISVENEKVENITNTTIDNNTNNDDKEKTESTKETNIESKENNKQESTIQNNDTFVLEEKKETSINNTTNNSIPKKEENKVENTPKQEVPKQEEPNKGDTPIADKKNETSSNQESKPVVKSICNNSNKSWNTHLNNYKKNNPSSMIFTSLTEAKSYGEYAMNNLGYGFWYNPIPEKYSDDECTIEFYAVQLYIPNNECVDSNKKGNPKLYIPATPKQSLVDNITYLVKKGYDCSGKCTIDGSKCY